MQGSGKVSEKQFPGGLVRWHSWALTSGVGVSFEQFGLSMERRILIGFTPVLHGREMAAQGNNDDFSGLLGVTHLWDCKG